MGELTETPVLLADADVLIDYAVADRTILGLVSAHIGPVKVIRQVLESVEQLSERDCSSLNIEIIDLETEVLLEAGARAGGGLSFEDRLGLIACRENGWTCLTNDGALIRACGEAKVRVCRGLRLMLDPVRGGVLTKRRALQIADAIHSANPHHINDRVLAEFRSLLGEP